MDQLMMIMGLIGTTISVIILIFMDQLMMIMGLIGTTISVIILNPYFITIITMLATVALAIVTYFYLRETTRIREIAQQDFSIKNRPMIYLGDFKTILGFDEQNKMIRVNAFLTINNSQSATTEAIDLMLNYSLSIAAPVKREAKETIGPIPYFFPGQAIRRQIKIFDFKLNDKNFQEIKERVDNKKPIDIIDSPLSPIFIDFELVYKDIEGKECKLKYRLKYSFIHDFWVFEDTK